MRSVIVLQVIAWAVRVASQSTCYTGTKTISSAAEATALISCVGLSGPVEIANGVPQDLVLKGILNTDKINATGVSGLKSLTLPGRGILSRAILNDLPDFEKLIVGPMIIDHLELIGLPSLTTFPTGTNAITDWEHLKIQNTGITSLQLSDKYNLIPSVVVQDNKYLKSLSSTLETVGVAEGGGNLTIVDNEILKAISFPNLTSVDDCIEIRGAFTDLQLPSLTNAHNVILESSNDIDDICAQLQDAQNGSKNGPAITGTLTCNGKKLILGASGKSNVPKGAKNTPNSSTSSAGLSSAAQIGIGVGVGLAGLIAIALITTIIVRRRRASKGTIPEISMEEEKTGANNTSAEGTSPEKRTEVVSSREIQSHELEHPAAQIPELSAESSRLEMGRNASSRFPGIESRYEM